MTYSIKRAAVIGSGVMGSGIAAHLANIGIPTLMLDISPEKLTEKEKAQGLLITDQEVKNRIVRDNKNNLTKVNPSPITSKHSLDLIEIGNMDDDMTKLGEVDWIIEVVVEDLNIKKSVFAEIDKYRKQGAIVSSNTSGISIEAMIEDCSVDMKKHFLGTHFFNPPRHLKLLEIIPTKDTDEAVITFMKQFSENELGKGVVLAKDTPNFIANRIGAYGLLITIEEMLQANLTVSEVDSITGPLIGRPRSATFRTLDIIGLDTFSQVVKNVYDQVDGSEREVFILPQFMIEMVKNNWLGAKKNKGFYEKIKGEDKNEILQINPQTMTYEPRKKLITTAVKIANEQNCIHHKIKTLISHKNDKAGKFVWRIMKQTLLYAARLLGEITDDIPSIDNAMKWGFGWELGPFELWDAIGLEKLLARMEAEGHDLPKWIIDMVELGYTSFYKYDQESVQYYKNGTYVTKHLNEKEINLQRIKEKRGVIKGNSGASLIDIGDGVLALEFHSEKNAIDFDVIQMIHDSLDIVETDDYVGLVIGNAGQNFCVGTNIELMLIEAQDQNYLELDLAVRLYQDAMMKIKYAEKPVVVAPFGMTLGGGAEVVLSATAVQASLETYIGLVEFGIGLIPSGGGTKKLYLKMLRDMPPGIKFDLTQVANTVFERVLMAKVSTSAQEAKEFGYLDNHDSISVNASHLLSDAKNRVLAFAKTGYKAPIREKIPVVGEAGFAAMLLSAKSLKLSGYLTSYELKVAEKLAYVLSGGRISEGTLIDEQLMLDLEREAFLSLIGEPETQMRMQHMIINGKPLRH